MCPVDERIVLFITVLYSGSAGICTVKYRRELLVRDRYTYHHAEKVVRYASWIGIQLCLPQGELRWLRVAALVHDLGKVHLEEKLLVKSGPLTPKEWEEMRLHPYYGAEILRPIFGEGKLLQAVLHHHECWDGHGYPEGLSGEQIPLLARIVSVADTFDAMTTERPYRKAKSVEEARVKRSFSD